MGVKYGRLPGKTGLLIGMVYIQNAMCYYILTYKKIVLMYACYS